MSETMFAPAAPDPFTGKLAAALDPTSTRFPDYVCSSLLEVTGPTIALRAFADRAGTPPAPLPEFRPLKGQLRMFEPEAMLPLYLAALVPIPNSVRRAGDSRYRAWLVEHWGASGIVPATLVRQDSPGRLTYRFDATQAPPIPWLARVARKHRALRFVLTYEWYRGRVEQAVFSGGTRIEEPSDDVPTLVAFRKVFEERQAA